MLNWVGGVEAEWAGAVDALWVQAAVLGAAGQDGTHAQHVQQLQVNRTPLLRGGIPAHVSTQIVIEPSDRASGIAPQAETPGQLEQV